MMIHDAVCRLIAKWVVDDLSIAWSRLGMSGHVNSRPWRGFNPKTLRAEVGGSPLDNGRAWVVVHLDYRPLDDRLVLQETAPEIDFNPLIPDYVRLRPAVADDWVRQASAIKQMECDVADFERRLAEYFASGDQPGSTGI